jgi:glycosyltransferase involved in cell wall biosynthesis
MNPNDPRPYYETPSSDADRGILLLTYHFPPSQAVGGVRWQMMSRYAAERGWHVDVIAGDPQQLPNADPARLKSLPPGVRVFGATQPAVATEQFVLSAWNLLRRFRPNRTVGDAVHGPPSSTADGSFSSAELRWRPTSLVDWHRAYSVWVDFQRRKKWAHEAVRLGRQIYKPGFHRVIISSGPPHMAHEGARLLSSRIGLPFVVDMRDPWSLMERVPEVIANPMFLRVARRYEARVVAHAGLIVANTEPARMALAALYPKAQSRMITVMNGYDDEPLPPPVRDGVFRVIYAGTLYLDRDPSLLFRSAARVVKELHLTADQFRIVFIGRADVSYSMGDLAEREGLGAQFVQMEPTCPRHELWQWLAHATVLVNLPQDSHKAIPSKVFEYMRFNAWLLALAEEGSATEIALRNTGADIVRPDDVDAITSTLLKRYREFAAGLQPSPLANDARLSRANQAGLFFDAVDGLCQRVATKPAD